VATALSFVVGGGGFGGGAKGGYGGGGGGAGRFGDGSALVSVLVPEVDHLVQWYQS
jgi:hypothetical protein